MVNSTQLLTTLLRTHEWAQYGYQSVGCMRSPSIGANCAQVYIGEGVPDINTPVTISPYNYDDGWDYAYTFVQFNGWQRGNFSALAPTWVNATKTTLLTSCLGNSTCSKLWTSYGLAAADTVLTNYVQAAVKNISSLLPVSGAGTWNPTTSYASALSTWTTIAMLENEVFGVHDGLVYGAFNTTAAATRAAQFEVAYALRVYLSGGAEMIETTLNFIAFRFYDHYGINYSYQGVLSGYTPPATSSTSSKTSSTTSTSKKTTTTTSKSTSSTKTTAKASVSTAVRARAAPGQSEFLPAGFAPNRKFEELQRMAKLRGPARKAVRELTMSNFRDLLVPLASSDLQIFSRDCSALTHITTIQGALQAVAALCSLATIQNAVLELSTISSVIGMDSIAQAMKIFGVSQIDTVASVIGAVSTVCAAGQLTCFPSSGIWNIDNAAAALSAMGIAVGLATGAAPASIAVNVACLAESFALQAYSAAAQCCQSNCNSPACTAGGIACTYPGMQC